MMSAPLGRRSDDGQLAEVGNRLHLIDFRLDSLPDYFRFPPNVALSALRACAAQYYGIANSIDETERFQFQFQSTSIKNKITQLADRLSVGVLNENGPTADQADRTVAEQDRSSTSTVSSRIVLMYLAAQHALRSRRSLVQALADRSCVRCSDDVIHEHVIEPGARTWLLERLTHWIDESPSARRPFFVLLGRSGRHHSDVQTF